MVGREQARVTAREAAAGGRRGINGGTRAAGGKPFMPQATGWHEGLPTSPRGRSALGETVAAGSGQRGASQVSVRQTLFNRKLADWLVFYNAERSHHSLSQQSPLSFLLQHQPKCQRYWTHTGRPSAAKPTPRAVVSRDRWLG
jgi:hypothetical protein